MRRAVVVFAIAQLCDGLIQHPQPGKDILADKFVVGILADVGPSAGGMPVAGITIAGFVVGMVVAQLTIGAGPIDGGFPCFDALLVEGFQPFEKEQIGDLLDGGQRIGHPARPKQGPQVEDFSTELRR